jgi:hypothetical protein
MARAQLEGMRTIDSLSDGPRTFHGENISAIDRGSSQNEHSVPRGKQPLDPIKATLCSITLVLSLVTLKHLAVTGQHRQLVRLSTGCCPRVECIEKRLKTSLRFR